MVIHACIHYAVSGDCRKVVPQTIINHSGDINATNTSNATALMLACNKGKLVKMGLLLNSGADPNIAVDAVDTLHHCEIKNNIPKETLQVVHDHRLNLNVTKNQTRTVSMLGREKGNVDAMRPMLNTRADPNINGVNGNTLPYNEVRNNISEQTHQTIIDHGADVNAVNHEGESALLLACKTGQREFVNVLLGAGKDTTIVNLCGDTCLHQILHREYHSPEYDHKHCRCCLIMVFP